MSARTSGLGLSDLVRLSLGQDRASLHVALPAKVLRFDAGANAVDVQPQLERVVERIDGTQMTEALPAIASVPVAWPRSGAFGLVFPLAAGDFVLVVVADRNLGEWLRTGEAGDPRDAGVHVLDGAVAIPGLYPLIAALTSEHVTDHLVIGGLGPENAAIHIRPHDVRVGHDSATSFAARADKLADHLSAISSDLTAIASAASTVATNYGAMGKAALDLSSPIAASIARVA